MLRVVDGAAGTPVGAVVGAVINVRVVEGRGPTAVVIDDDDPVVAGTLADVEVDPAGINVVPTVEFDAEFDVDDSDVADESTESGSNVVSGMVVRSTASDATS